MDLGSTPSVRVAFRPPAAGLGGDRLFLDERYQHVGDASHWMEPIRRLARDGRAQRIEFHTDDMLALADADVLVFGEVPSSRHEVMRIRSLHPRLKLILQILETPIGRAWVFDTSNHALFDAVVTYHPGLQGLARYFTFKIPAGGLESTQVPQGQSWAARKIACMVSHVPDAKPWWFRRSGAGLVRKGWRLTPRTWWHWVAESGSLYRERLMIARACEDVLGDQFDIFGPGWPAAPSRGGFASARGPFTGSKLTLLQTYRFTIAYENCLNDCGYVTEKMFDALLAGCVPVYLGNESIQTLVPPAAFVDARRFTSRTALARFLANVPEGQWHEMRAAGKAFLSGEAIARFGSAQYVQAMLGAVRRVAAMDART